MRGNLPSQSTDRSLNRIFYSFFVDAPNLLDEKYIASASVAAIATPASAL